MSAIVKTITPFLEKNILLEALDSLVCAYQCMENRIIIPSLSQYRQAYFEKDTLGKFVLFHDSHVSTKKLLQDLSIAYQKMYRQKIEQLEQQRILAEKKRLENERQKAEAERIRLEEEKKQYIQKQKDTIRHRAQEMGYQVQEKQTGGKIQLVLVKRTY